MSSVGTTLLFGYALSSKLISFIGCSCCSCLSFHDWERSELGPIEDMNREGIWYNWSGSHMIQYHQQTQDILAVQKGECTPGSQKTCGYLSVWKFLDLFVRCFSPAPNINDFPICHSKPLNQSGTLPGWDGFEIMGQTDLFMAMTWVINHMEWPFAESGKLFMIDGNGPGWRKKKLRRSQILIWNPTPPIWVRNASNKFLLLLENLLAVLQQEKEQWMAN